MPFIVSANRLSDGVVIYARTDTDWTLHIENAKITSTKAECNALLSHAESQHEVIAPYIIETSATEPHKPTLFREQMRTKGPSVRLDLGLQADGAQNLK